MPGEPLTEEGVLEHESSPAAAAKQRRHPRVDAHFRLPLGPSPRPASHREISRILLGAALGNNLYR